MSYMTFCSYICKTSSWADNMKSKTKRATIYFDPILLKALRLKSAETERSMSELVNNAVRILLAEDAEDLAALRERKAETSIGFEQFVEELSARGEI